MMLRSIKRISFTQAEVECSSKYLEHAFSSESPHVSSVTRQKC
jgi:hypothetical protein